MPRLHGLAAVALSATAAVVVDQVAKALVRDGLRECSGPPVALCDRIALVGPVGILRTVNDDGALGILDAGWLGLVGIVAMAAIAIVVRQRGVSATFLVGLSLLFGGALSNLVDRIAFRTVTDFIDFRSGMSDVGLVVNTADIALLAGTILFWIAAARRVPRAARIAHHASGHVTRRPD